MTEPKRKLTLIAPGQELSGAFPRGFERAALSAQSGDAAHRALLFTITTVTRRTLNECVAPLPRARLLESLQTALDWAKGDAVFAQVRRERSQTFERARESVEATVSVLNKILATTAPGSALDAHADHVIRRYTSLGAHLAVDTVLACLDAVLDPKKALEVAKTAAAAIAYRNVGLGAARDLRLRQAATEQASWEIELPGAAAHDTAALSLQLFHEYLGVHWKNHVDAQRLYIEQFLAWVFRA